MLICLGGGYPISGVEEGGTPSHVQGGIPSQVWGGAGGTPPRSGGTPSQVQCGGVPHPRSGVWGYPIPCPGVPHPKVGDSQGTSHHLDLVRVPPHLRPEMGYPLPQHLDLTGVLPPPDLRWGTPRKCEQTENITFPHPSDGGR